MNSIYWLNTIMGTMYTNNENGFYVGLSSTPPNKYGAGISEPAGGNYNRVRVTAFSEPVDGVVKNTTALEFPRSTTAWFPAEAKAAYWVLFDGNGSGANLLSCGELDEAKTVESNTTITIASEALNITLTDYSSTASV